MGKSPGKWIKAVLFRKKASKSNLSKRRDISKFSHEKASLAPSEEPVSNLAGEPLCISAPAPIAVADNDEKEKPQNRTGEVASVPNAESTVSSSKQDDDAQTATKNGVEHYSERIMLEQAASKVQATFRGYLARRAFRTLKGIIRLQAVIRGHLVRRQAVTTLYCVLGIVKFQALVRGQMIRLSVAGSKVGGEQSLSRRDTGPLDSNKVNTCRQEKLLKNAFLRQLLCSSPTAVPVRLRYDPGEPNSASSWLIRWTMSRVWSPPCERTTIFDLKQKLETQKAGPKPSGQKKRSANVENASARPTSESEKLKSNPRKDLNQHVKSGKKQTVDQIDKVKHNMKKISSSASEIPIQSEVDTEKPKVNHKKVETEKPNCNQRKLDTEKQNHNHKKSSNSTVPELTGHKTENTSDKSMEDMEGPVSNLANEEKCTLLPAEDDPVNDLDGCPVSKVQDKQFTEKNESISHIDRDFQSKEDQISNGNDKISKRRASLPAKHDDQETGQRGARMPSYMAATESAKAKVKSQASPRFGQDMDQKVSVTRRHSLPSSINGKQSSSPRVQRLIQASGKGGTRIDRSLSSSRDSNDKVIQAEWRR